MRFFELLLDSIFQLFFALDLNSSFLELFLELGDTLLVFDKTLVDVSLFL
jgi:hypothetical protein